MPLTRRTRHTLRRAEFGFFGVVVYTRVHTPRFCGLPLRAGVFFFSTDFLRPLRTNWLIVGKSLSPFSPCTTWRLSLAARQPLEARSPPARGAQAARPGDPASLGCPSCRENPASPALDRGKAFSTVSLCAQLIRTRKHAPRTGRDRELYHRPCSLSNATHPGVSILKEQGFRRWSAKRPPIAGRASTQSRNNRKVPAGAGTRASRQTAP